MEENPYQSPQTAAPAADTVYRKPTTKELLFSFEGRVPRRVYWGVTLLLMLVAIVFVVLVIATLETAAFTPIMAILVLIAIPFYWISIAITVKRFHDRNKSGWWWLINFVPYIGGFWILIECGCLRGTIGDNTYGPDPT